jgi:hypothetical protein
MNLTKHHSDVYCVNDAADVATYCFAGDSAYKFCIFKAVLWIALIFLDYIQK